MLIWLSGVLMATGGAIMLWPKPAQPPEIMTLVIWGPPNEDAGVVQWIHGKASNEQAKAWRVWQPANYVLKHRFVIEGKPIND